MSPKVIAAAILALAMASQIHADEVKETPNHQTDAIEEVTHQKAATESPRASKEIVTVEYAALHKSTAVPQEIRIQSAEEVFTHNSCCP